MTAEFNWWLLIVGVVVGALLTWLVLADSARRDRDITEQEVPAEAGWLARTLADEGLDVDPAVTEAMLRAHRRYLGLPPPDAFVDPETLERVEIDPGDGAEIERADDHADDQRVAGRTTAAPPAAPQGRAGSRVAR
jgi:hypothetical protein